jgi:hypothetical protein
MDAHFESTEHLHGLVVHAGGLRVSVGRLILAVRSVINNIEDESSCLKSHEEIAKELKEALSNDSERT